VAGPLRDIEKIAASFRRVRIAEQPLDDGGKSVWHQGEGAEITSRVDAKGHVLEQQLTLGDRTLEWSRAEGIRTGRLRQKAREGMPGAHEAELVERDPQFNPGTAVEALSFLTRVPPGDRYVEHLKTAVEGLLHSDEGPQSDTVTGFAGFDRPAAAPPPPRRSAKPAVIAAAALLVLAVAGWLLLM
jgi:hypothetical protein